MSMQLDGVRLHNIPYSVLTLLLPWDLDKQNNFNADLMDV